MRTTWEDPVAEDTTLWLWYMEKSDWKQAAMSSLLDNFYRPGRYYASNILERNSKQCLPQRSTLYQPEWHDCSGDGQLLSNWI